MQKLLETLVKVRVTPETYKSLPETSGVYIFFKGRSAIYIGKAINLKRRVSSYFDIGLEPKTASMMHQAEFVGFIQVASELEALLLEAKLIRKYMPHYNIAAKDDKHPLYIAITKEEYPRVYSVRKLTAESSPLIASYGPFPSSANVRSVLKMIRRIFPYSDHKLGKRPCLYSHINLCSPCPNLIDQSEDKENLKKIYLKNIKNIKSILDGNIAKVVRNIEKEMKSLSKAEDYEAALKLRNKITRLEYITRPQIPAEFYMQNPNLYEDTKRKEIKQLKALLAMKNIIVKNLSRIECYDIAHLGGTSATASMVTFTDGEPDKNYYRHFKIKKARGGDDYGSLSEIAKRRTKHFADWGVPDLIIVDGGTGQVKSFSESFGEGYKIPIVGIAKHPDRLIIGKEKVKLTGAALNLVARVRDEAHRFARRYHHSLISNSIKHAVAD
jgi:excinuclease ABC subunit C